MSRTTILYGDIDLTTKKIDLTDQIAIREKIELNFTGYGTAGASDLICAIVYDGELMALLQPMVDHTTYIGGVLDTNTQEIVAVFDNAAPNCKIKMTLVVWDTTNSNMLVNDFVWVEQNPYDPSMETPTSVGTIGGVQYAPLANGVTNGNSHTHQNGDGALLDPYYLRTDAANGEKYRRNADGIHLDLKDEIDGHWYTITLNNGAITTVQI